MRHELRFLNVGTSIELTDDLPDPTKVGLIDQTVAWLRDVDRRFNPLLVDSEVNQLDRGEITVADCSADLREVMAMCAELWRESDGYFDAYATGQLDPSGFARGWALEVASRFLLANGSANHCLNAGGDIRARGGPAPGLPWRIPIRHPGRSDKVTWMVTGTDLAVATSDVWSANKVLDPTSGKPASQLRSVTVVGADLGRVDGYATAAMAMGKAGLKFLAELDVAGFASAAITADGRAITSRQLPVANFVS